MKRYNFFLESETMKKLKQYKAFGFENVSAFLRHILRTFFDKNIL